MNIKKRLSIILSVCMLVMTTPINVLADEPILPPTELVEEKTATVSETGVATPSEENDDASIKLVTVAGDGMVVTLKAGNDAFEYTEGLSLEAIVVSDEVAEEADKELEAKTKDDNVAKRVTYDIRVMHDGEEIQPVDGNKVKVEFTMSNIPSGADEVSVYHHNEETDEIETIVSETLTDDAAVLKTVTEDLEVSEDDDYSLEDGDIIDDVTVEGETGSFSLYTVDFTYNEKTVSIDGGTTHNKLADVLTKLNITESIISAKAYQDVECTKPATDGIVTGEDNKQLFSVYEEAGVWYVDAINSFTTEHGLVVKTINAEYQIKVTYEQKVCSITAGAEDAIGDYESIFEALNEVTDSTSTTIVLNKDMIESTNVLKSIPISKDKNITIDLKGYVLDLNGNHIISHNANLTIKSSVEKPGEIKD